MSIFATFDPVSWLLLVLVVACFALAAVYLWIGLRP